MALDSVEPVYDTTAAKWLEQALQGTTGTVADLLPPHYPAYVRVPRAIDVGSQVKRTLFTLRDILIGHTNTPQDCWFTFYTGFALPQAWQKAPRLKSPNNDQILFRASLANLEDVCATFNLVGYDEPTLWWPSDRAWVTHWDVDSDAAYVACSWEAAMNIVEAGVDASLEELQSEVTLEQDS